MFSRSEAPASRGFSSSWDGAARSLRAVPAGACDTQADFFRRPREISVPCHDDNFIITQLKRGRQMDRVVTAQSQVFGVLAGTNRKLPINTDRGQVRIQILKACEHLVVLIRPEPIQPAGSRECRPALGIDKDA